MKYKKNKISINESESNLLFILLICILGFALLPISIIMQVIFLLLKQYTVLIILDSILIGIILLIAIYFFLKCFCSSVTIKKEVIIIQEMLFIKKYISFEDIASVEVTEYSKSNPLLNDLWGKNISLFGKDNQLVLKFAYNDEAYNVLKSKLEKTPEELVIDDENNIYDQYYQKMKDNA